jgi:HD superfamily phosphohydrolase YqeK
MEKDKEIILKILKENIKREGIDDLIKYLSVSDFFTAPCSTMFHLACAGGLAKHSLNVYELLLEKIKRYSIDVSPESIAICGLLHDICKTNFYVKARKNVKENGCWIEKEVFAVKDQLPLGHGEKSAMIIQDYIKLINMEKLAIRWHMLAFDAGIHFNYPTGFAFREASKNPLVVLLFTADYEASQIIEKEKGK